MCNMPKSPSVSTLKDVSLANIAKNMERIWCADYSQNFFDQGTFLYLIGPFDSLTSDLIQDLISVLSKRGLMKTYFLHLLIDSRIKHLDLSCCRAAANKDTVMSLVATRCKRLVKLNISSCNQVPPRVLTDLVAALPNIAVLNLKQTKCSDQVLNRIGQCCHNLRELDISSCPVSDMGIMSLCVSFGDQPAKCEKLVKLNVLSTAVTAKGAEVALSNLPNMRVFEFSDICEALYRLFGSQCKREDGEGRCDVRKLALQYLSIQQMKASLAPVTKSIEVSCLICPFVTGVYFVRGVTNEGLIYLSALEHLRVLTLANSEEELITFAEGVLPLLQIRGSTIEDLSLNDINNVDIGCVGACCPNLKKFSCLVAGYGVATFPVFTQPQLLSTNVTCFTKLEQLKILLHCPQNTFPATFVKLLLANSPNVTRISLNNIESFSDDVFFEILRTNPLIKLESLRLETCQHISAQSIWKVLGSENVLSYLNLSHCLEITRQDVDEFKRYCAGESYKIDILWC